MLSKAGDLSRLCIHSVEKTIPLLTLHRPTVHIMLIFFSLALSFDIPAQLPWEERAGCLFCWSLFHFAGEKEAINIVLPFILYTDNAGIAWRWKEIVHYCHPGRWHEALPGCRLWTALILKRMGKKRKEKQKEVSLDGNKRGIML